LQPFVTEVQTYRRNKNRSLKKTKDQKCACRHICTKILKDHLTSSAPTVLGMKSAVGFPPQATAEAAPEQPKGSAGSWYRPQLSEESITPWFSDSSWSNGIWRSLFIGWLGS
jgi:hypothetical protein